MATPREKKKAADVIAEECQGKVLRQFPAEWLQKTLEEIHKAADKGDKSAKTAKKLLNDHRFKK